jgi:ankyrin repeat protein
VYGIQAMRHVAVAVVNVREYVRFLFMPSSDPLTNRKNLHNALELAAANGHDRNAEFIMKLRTPFHRGRAASDR